MGGGKSIRGQLVVMSRDKSIKLCDGLGNSKRARHRTGTFDLLKFVRRINPPRFSP